MISLSHLGMSLISVLCPITPAQSLDSQRLLAQWEKTDSFFFHFLWNDCWFQSETTQWMPSGLGDGDIPFSNSTPHAKIPWFDHAFSHAIKDRLPAHKIDLSLQTSSNVLFESAWNKVKSIHWLDMNYSIIRKCQKFANSHYSRLLPIGKKNT